jgi:hypothetical protein
MNIDLRGRAKRLICRLALAGLIPLTFADHLIRRLGLRHA